jgi:hypothetical protein
MGSGGKPACYAIVMGTLRGFPNPPAMGSGGQARLRPTRS